MGLMSGLVVYVMIWWIVIFTMLPWGVYPESSPVPGNAIEAPAKTYLKRKLILTTLLSFLIWLAIYWIIQADIIHFDY